MKRSILALCLAACGGSTTAPPPRPAGPPAALQPTPAPADVQVATVNGQPVWGSCVTAQAAHAATKQEALKQCIDFELMAQEAAAKDLALDPDVVYETHKALVSQLVAKDYEDKFVAPADFGPLWDQLYQRNRLKFDHVEYRGSAYVRVNVAKTATPDEDAKAHEIAEDIATKLASERGLMPDHLVALAQQIAGTRATLAHEVVTPYARGGLDKAYEDALWSIKEIGETAPHAVRTPWGWDVILFSEDVPELHASSEQVERELMPEMKRQYFALWANQIAQKLGVKPEIVEKNLPLLESM